MVMKAVNFVSLKYLKLYMSMLKLTGKVEIKRYEISISSFLYPKNIFA